MPERALQTYARLWEFETWLRRMIYVELRAKAGDEWAGSLGTNKKAFNADKELKHMPTPEMNALSYSPLSQLASLIQMNWECFEPYFPPQTLWEAKLSEISQIRHRIAHFRLGHPDDYDRLRQFLRDVDQGFWTFCTSYNDSWPPLPHSSDAVANHFIDFHPLPWSQIETGEWIQVGSVNREPVIGVTVNRLRRPWVHRPPEDGAPGFLYDIELRANDRLFDYPAVLENTERLHAQLCHLGLEAFEQSIRLTLPAVLGSGRVIEVVEQFIKSATYGVRRGRNPITPKAQALADEWPEYVLGPHDALMYLGPGMKGRFFKA